MAQPVIVVHYATLICVDPAVNVHKVYHVQLVTTVGGFQVVAQYGRIGGRLSDASKSDAHISYARACDIYNRLVTDKRREYMDDAPAIPDVERYAEGYHIVSEGPELEQILQAHSPVHVEDPTKALRVERADRRRRARGKEMAGVIARLIDDSSMAPASDARFITIHKTGGSIRIEGASDVRGRELARRAALEIGGSFVGYGYVDEPAFVLVKADRQLDELLARARPLIVRAGEAPHGLREAKCAALRALLQSGPDASAGFDGISNSVCISREDLVAALPHLDPTHYQIPIGADHERSA